MTPFPAACWHRSDTSAASPARPLLTAAASIASGPLTRNTDHMTYRISSLSSRAFGRAAAAPDSSFPAIALCLPERSDRPAQPLRLTPGRIACPNKLISLCYQVCYQPHDAEVVSDGVRGN